MHSGPIKGLTMGNFCSNGKDQAKLHEWFLSTAPYQLEELTFNDGYTCLLSPSALRLVPTLYTTRRRFVVISIRLVNGRDCTINHVDNHMKKTDLMVVYTEDPVMVETSINTMELLLDVEDKYELVGFDLAYTDGRAEHDEKVVFAKLCVFHHILLYHYCMATTPCKILTRFVNNRDYRFATMDTTNDPKVLKTLSLACQNIINIHDHYKVSSNKKDMDYHGDLVVAIIDPYYRDMKAEGKENKLVWHMAWVERLDEYHIQIAARKRTQAMRCSSGSLT
ncbi:hypothetical protein D1007_42982 [Hordeum vulgare]|nr:hypothetical protein D1007_42982 [Hordeum vulgare]